ncbi:MAG: hypothetical protein SGPRY_010178 [Prymnesium sp.]
MHPKVGEWLYHARGVGHFPTAHMPPTEVTAPLGHTASSAIAFRNPFAEPLMLSIKLEQSVEPSASFELLARRAVGGIEVSPLSGLQLPFSFVPRDMSEQHANFLLSADYKGKTLTWTFPKPLVISTPARQPILRELQLPVPGLLPDAAEESFTYELDVPPDTSPLLSSSLTLTPASSKLRAPTLTMHLDWRPLRPLRSMCALVVRKASGGRWRYELLLEAGPPQPDDTIHIEAPIHKTAAVSFRLCNAFEEDASFSAYFSSETSTVFSVSPQSGVLPARGELTDEMQWSYEVRGTHPRYHTPVATRDPLRLQQPLKKDEFASKR